MTTPAAAARYLAEHLVRNKDLGWAVFNPQDKPLEELPVIYGFNNSGPSDYLMAVLIAEDGTVLGSHICSHEYYMPYDLGILEGTRPDRHDTFKLHYPNGYRMEFVGRSDAPEHNGLNAALDAYDEGQK